MKKATGFFLVGFFCCMFAACGGGGGGSASGAPATPPDYWVDRYAGQLDTSVFAALPGTAFNALSVRADGTMAAFGTSGSSAKIAFFTSSGTLSAAADISGPLGNSVLSRKAAFGANGVALLYNMAPLGNLFVSVYDTLANRISAEVQAADSAEAGDIAWDGTNVVFSRIQRNPSMDSQMLFVANIGGGAPFSAAPPMAPECILVVGDGYVVAGENRIVKYSKDITAAPLWDIPFSAASVPAAVHSLSFSAGKIYAAGTVDGTVAVFAFDAAGGARIGGTNNAAIPSLGDRIRLHTDQGGNLFVTVGPRIGRVNANGAVTTTVPPKVPTGEWVISGTKAYFVHGDTIQALDLSGI